jgi:hypothetical protein
MAARMRNLNADWALLMLFKVRKALLSRFRRFVNLNFSSFRKCP